MKKSLFVLVVCLISCISASAQSKIIYSNPITHCYITEFLVNDNVLYQISETSDRKIWRFADREETQVLGLFTKKEVLTIFNSVISLYAEKKLNKTIEINDVVLTYKKIYGIKCVNFTHKKIGVNFNINKKTAMDVVYLFQTK